MASRLFKITDKPGQVKFVFMFCFYFYHGATGANTGSLFVKEGDSVTLHTDIGSSQQDRIRWYFNDTRIAQLSGDLSKTCTDVQCNEGAERFRDRLKLDHQTGSLTIINTRTNDSGVYKVHESSSSDIKIFIVTVSVVSDPVSSTAGIRAGAVAVVLMVAAAAVIYTSFGKLD